MKGTFLFKRPDGKFAAAFAVQYYLKYNGFRYPVTYENKANALATRRKLYNRYGIVFDVHEVFRYLSDANPPIVCAYSHEMCFSRDFGNPPACKSMKGKLAAAYKRGYNEGYKVAFEEMRA